MRQDARKTRSARSVLNSEGRTLALVLVGVLLLCARRMASVPVGPHLTVGSTMIALEVADTEQEREKGLSGRKIMAQNRGILFIFDTERSDLCFWMKDMHFPIDIIWTDSAKRVVHIVSNLLPSTYPNTFCPPKPARYVIELNAGSVGKLKIHAKQSLDFEI